MRSLLLRALSVTSLMTLAACSSETAETTPPPAAPPTETPPAEEPAPADPAKTACEEETAKLQKGIDGAHAKTTDVVLAVKTPACGLRVLPSGPGNVQPTDVHRIGSVTKTYVASVILDLAKEGKLTLEDPVSKYVENAPGLAAITIRQILNHTSGLYNYTKDPSLEFAKKTTPRELVDRALAKPASFEPGKGWEYSNTGFILLGMIAEKVTGAKIAALVRTRVLEKAKLGATFFDGEEPVNAKLAVGRGANGADIGTSYDLSWAWAAGAIVATPADVISWVEQLGSGSFFDAATQKELLTPANPAPPGGMGYGLGIELFPKAVTLGAGPGVGHGGDIMGYHTQAFYFPEKKTSVVSIVDSDAENPNDLSIVALEVLMGTKAR